MGLNYRLSDITDYRSVCFERRTFTTDEEREALLASGGFMGPHWGVVNTEPGVVERLTVTTNTLILATMNVGMGHITEKTVKEFYTRLRMQETAFGAYRRDGAGNDHPFTYAEVRAHIGLWTNAGTETNGAFHKRLTTNLRRDAALTMTMKEAA
jgi:hypothetical protein